MSKMAITKEELLTLIDAIVRHAPDELALKPTGVWQHGHDEFGRRLATYLTEALRDHGFAWAKIPAPGDALYRVVVSAISSAGSTHRLGVTSEDSTAREIARSVIADEILNHLRVTETAVVRRRQKRLPGS